jgi:hypothetical protein
MSGARDDFLSRRSRSLHVSAQISSQRDFSRYQAAWRLNDQTLRTIGPAHNVHRYGARVGDRPLELLDVRHCDVLPVRVVAPTRCSVKRTFDQILERRLCHAAEMDQPFCERHSIKAITSEARRMA